MFKFKVIKRFIETFKKKEVKRNIHDGVIFIPKYYADRYKF